MSEAANYEEKKTFKILNHKHKDMFPLLGAGAGLYGNNGDISLESDAPQQDWHPGRQPVVPPDYHYLYIFQNNHKNITRKKFFRTLRKRTIAIELIINAFLTYL